MQTEKINRCRKMLLQDVAPAVETGMLAQHKDVKAIEAKNTCLNSDTTSVNCGRSIKCLHGQITDNEDIEMLVAVY